jgi:DNA-binding transcriptional LysR family regulator
MSFSLKHARYFVATARSGQVSRAAVELNVSQSAVTSALQQLEDRLGVILFERRAHGMTLTFAGARFLTHAEHILAAVNEATRAAIDMPAQPRGEVHVGVSYTVAGYFFGPLFARARRALPQIDIVLHEAHRADIERDLVSAKIDLAIMLTSNLADREGIAHETLAHSARRLWVSDEHPLTKKKSVTLRDAMQYPYIALSVDEALTTQRRYWRDLGVEPNVIFETASVEAVRTMVATGIGVTVLSDMVYRPWSLDGARIETVNLTDPVPSMEIGMAWRAGHAVTTAALALCDFLRRAIE